MNNIIQRDSLESYYEQTMNYLQDKYHTYPSNLPNYYVSAEERSRTGNPEKLASNIAADANFDGSVPLGKLVV